MPAATGPECDAQKTFAAVAGTRYDIGVDGYYFYAPGETPAPGEGMIALRIAALPPPPNDSFASPGSIQQIIWVSPDGNRTMLADSSGGYNWGATSEPGEPVHAGVGGGASIWYSFVAPAAGTVNVSTGATGETDYPVLAVYTGSSVSALTPIVSSAQAGRGASFTAEAGQEFRIAIDGRADAEGVPWMGNVDLVLGEQLPPGTGNASGAPEWDLSFRDAIADRQNRLARPARAAAGEGALDRLPHRYRQLSLRLRDPRRPLPLQPRPGAVPWLRLAAEAPPPAARRASPRHRVGAAR